MGTDSDDVRTKRCDASLPDVKHQFVKGLGELGLEPVVDFLLLSHAT